MKITETKTLKRNLYHLLLFVEAVAGLLADFGKAALHWLGKISLFVVLLVIGFAILSALPAMIPLWLAAILLILVSQRP